MPFNALDELQRTRTELDQRFNSLHSAMQSLRGEINRFENMVGNEEEGEGSHDAFEWFENEEQDGGATGTSVPRPFNPTRSLRGQVTLLGSPPGPSATLASWAASPTVSEMDLSYRAFVNERTSLLSSASTPASRESVASISSLTDDGQLRTLLRPLRPESQWNVVSNPEARPNAPLAASSATTRRTSIAGFAPPTGASSGSVQAVDQVLRRVDETSLDLTHARSSIRDQTDSLRLLSERGVDDRRVGVLDETLRVSMGLIDRLEGRLGFLRERLSRTPTPVMEENERREEPVRLGGPVLQRSEISTTLASDGRPSISQNIPRTNRLARSVLTGGQASLFSASPETLQSPPFSRAHSPRMDSFTSWANSRDLFSSNPTGMAPSSLTAASLPSLERPSQTTRGLFFSFAPSTRSDTTMRAESASAASRVPTQVGYRDDGLSMGMLIEGGSSLERGGRRNRPWNLEGHTVGERGDADWPEGRERSNSDGPLAHDIPRDALRASSFSRAASTTSPIVSIPSRFSYRGLLSTASSTRLRDQGLNIRAQPPRQSASSSPTTTLSPHERFVHGLQRTTYRVPFRTHEILGTASTEEEENPMVVADRLNGEPLGVCENEVEQQREDAGVFQGEENVELEGGRGAGYEDEGQVEWGNRPGPMELSDYLMEPWERKGRGRKRNGGLIGGGKKKVVLLRPEVFVGR